jgi:hypothetical protein
MKEREKRTSSERKAVHPADGLHEHDAASMDPEQLKQPGKQANVKADGRPVAKNDVGPAGGNWIVRIAFSLPIAAQLPLLKDQHQGVVGGHQGCANGGHVALAHFTGPRNLQDAEAV